jgi:hypothetical protein
VTIQDYTPGMKLEGFIRNMPEKDYFAAPGFSYSASKEFMKSPAHYKAYLTKERELDPEREMFKAVHLLTLEADKANRIVVVDGVWRDKVKAEVQAKQADGYIVLKQKDFDRARDIAASILSNPAAMEILEGSENEVSMFWTDPNTGTPCKGRVDVLKAIEEFVFISDLKNLSQLHDEEMIGQQVLRMKYQYQMAFYAMGFNTITGLMPYGCKWIFVEDELPFGVKVRSCPQVLLDSAWIDYANNVLQRFKECTFSNDWSSYDSQSKELTLPKWFQKGVNNE